MNEKSEIIFNSEEKFSTSLRDQLETLADGLIYVSETDAPITAFAIRGGGVDAEHHLKSMIGAKTDVPFTISDDADLTAKLTAIRDWYGDAEKERSAKFARLFDTLHAALSDVRLYRSGTTRVEIMVAGVDQDGDLVGIRTQAVET